MAMYGGLKDLPLAGELVASLLRRLERGGCTPGEFLEEACSLAKVPPRKAHVAYPPSTNNSLEVRYHAAVDYLVTNGYVALSKGKNRKYALTDKGREISPDSLADPIPDIEPKFRAFAPTPPPQPAFRPRSPASRRQADTLSPTLEAAIRGAEDRHVAEVVAKATAALAKTPLSRLYQQYANVSAKTGDPDWRIARSALGIMAAIDSERQRRESLVVGSGRREGAFRWPSTDATAGNGDGGLEIDSEKSGVLSNCGYVVGHTRGDPEEKRRDTLRRLFEGDVPSVDFPDGYRLSWGGNGSGARLRKMAYTIAAQTRNFKRRDLAVLDRAIGEWEADLRFLHDEYYVGKFTFEWPDTEIGAGLDQEAIPEATLRR